MKRFFSLLLVLALCLGLFCSPALAAEADGPVYETIIGGYDAPSNIRAVSPPGSSSFKNLGGDANYYIATLIDLTASKSSYTLYYFATGTGRIWVNCKLERSGTTVDKNRQLKIILYEKETATSAGVIFDTRTINFSDAESTQSKMFYGLDVNKFYYICFFNNSSTDPDSDMEISGRILVDDIENTAVDL